MTSERADVISLPSLRPGAEHSCRRAIWPMIPAFTSLDGTWSSSITDPTPWANVGEPWWSRPSATTRTRLARCCEATGVTAAPPTRTLTSPSRWTRPTRPRRTASATTTTSEMPDGWEDDLVAPAFDGVSQASVWVSGVWWAWPVVRACPREFDISKPRALGRIRSLCASTSSAPELSGGSGPVVAARVSSDPSACAASPRQHRNLWIGTDYEAGDWCADQSRHSRCSAPARPPWSVASQSTASARVCWPSKGDGRRYRSDRLRWGRARGTEDPASTRRA